jgi:hypothetical protein
LIPPQQPLPTVQLPQEENLDVADLAKACAEEMAVLIRNLASRHSSTPLEIIEAILSLRECLTRLKDWNVNLSSVQSLLDPSVRAHGLMGKLTKTLLRLMSQLVRLDQLLGAGTGTYRSLN